MAKILILGAGIFQVPLILQAKEMGCQVLVASIKGNYPGIELADLFIEADTSQTDQIVNIAKQHRIEAIVTTGTDISVPALAAVAEELNLPGPTQKVAQTVSSKTQLRQFQKKHGLNCPGFSICKKADDAVDFFKNNTGKTVFKPDDASGSRGVSIIEPDTNIEKVINAYHNAMQYSMNKVVCAEQFMVGIEVGGDAFLQNGRFLFLTTTTKHMDGVIVRGHSLPGDLPKNDIEKIKKELLALTGRLGYSDGPLNFDVFVGNGQATILEAGLRNGGNGIPEIIKYAYNVDLIKILLSFAFGTIIDDPDINNVVNSSSYIFGSKTAGKIKRITPFNELKTLVPELKQMHLAKKPGENIDVFNHNANLAGFCIINCDSKNYKKVTSVLHKHLIVEVE